VFHSEIAEGKGEFSFSDVAKEISDKLVRRHPHVYGDSSVDGSDGVLSQWDEIKKQEKGGEETKGYLDKVGEELPAILRAAKIQKKVGKIGFDWPDAESVIGKIDEELEEVKAEIEDYEEGTDVSEGLKNEIGDLLFSVVNLARKLKLNPEELIDRTNHKFIKRFHSVEQSMQQQGLELNKANLVQMEEAWTQAKEND